MTWQELCKRAEGKDVYSFESAAKNRARQLIYDLLVYREAIKIEIPWDADTIIAEYCDKNHIQFNNEGKVISADNMDVFNNIPDKMYPLIIPDKKAAEMHNFPTLQEYGQDLIDMGYGDKIILCLDSAAGWMCLSNQFSATRVLVYTDLPQEELPDFVKKYDVSYKDKDIFICKGLQCTTELQTLCDMLEYEDGIGNQDLYEALSDFYYLHNESFAELENLLNEHQMKILDMYKEDAIGYHEWG